MAATALDKELGELGSELEFLEKVPALAKQHGEAKVKEALKTHLTGSQIKQCFKLLAARAKLLAWVELSTTGGQLVELAIIITDLSLNEVERGTWTFGVANEAQLQGAAAPNAAALAAELVAEVRTSKLTLEGASFEIVHFLRTHCARGTCKLAGRSIAGDKEILRRALPDVHNYLDQTSCVDLSHAGTSTFASLLELPMLSTRNTGDGPATAHDFEEEQRLSHGAGRYGTMPRDARAIDRVEHAILALAWAREKFIAPPKAAKYVTWGLHGLCVFLLASIVHALYEMVSLAPEGGGGLRGVYRLIQ